MMPRQRVLVLGDEENWVNRLTDLLDPDQFDVSPGNWNGAKGDPVEFLVLRTARNAEIVRCARERWPGAKMFLIVDEATPTDATALLKSGIYRLLRLPLSDAAIADWISRAAKDTFISDYIEVLSGRPHWISIRLNCRMETADRVLQFVHEVYADLPEQEQLAMAFREILLNAIEHGGHCDPRQLVDVSLVRTDRSLVYYVRDPGDGFSADGLTTAAIGNPPDDPIRHLVHREEKGQRAGGFGLMLVRQLVDEVIYNEKGNEVLLIKRLSGERVRGAAE